MSWAKKPDWYRGRDIGHLEIRFRNAGEATARMAVDAVSPGRTE